MSSAAALFVNPAFSQKTDDKPEEDEVIKLSTFSVSTDAYHGYVASSTLIGGKTAQKITDVPQTVSVVTRDLIDDIGAVTPQEALNRLVPGVSVVSRQGSSSAGTYIRGFRVQNWAVDGATMRALDTLSTFNVDAIEVIKGPASVTFGAFAAYGGYVSILPKYAHRNQKNKVQFDVGTDNFYSGMIDIGDELGKDGDFQYRLVLGSLSSDRAGWEYDFDKSLTIAPSFAYDFSENNRVRVRFAITETDTKNSTTALDINGNVVKGFSSNGPSDEYHNEEQGYSTQMVWETELNDEWSTKMNIFGARGHIDWMGNNLRSSTTLAQDYFVNPYKRDYTWTNFYVDYSVSFKKDEIANTGISYQAVGSLSMDHWNNHYTLWDVNQYAPWSGYKIDPTNPNWALLPTSSELLFPTRYIYYNTEWLGGAVIENVVGLFKDKLLLSAAIRFNYDNRSSHTAWREPRTNAPGGTYVGDPTPTNINEKATKRFGIVYKPTDKMSIYAGSTEAFLAVGAIFKADGSRLDPETGKNEEIGFKLDFLEALGGNFSFTGAMFRINVVNKWRGDPNNAGFFVQDGAQESNGFDAQLSYTSQKLSFIAGYFQADDPNDKLSGLRGVIVPETTWNFWGKYSITENLIVGGGLKHMGDALANDRRFTVPAFTTADLFAAYTTPMYHGTMTYRLGVTNITDEEAVIVMSGASTVQREEGRRYKFSASYSW